MKTEHALPPTLHPTIENALKDAELRAMKLLDRNVRDTLGGLREVPAEHGQSRHFLLPQGAICPYSYRRCMCRKCEWVIGREPLYASDVVRFYQSRHPEEVINPIPPPPTCEDYASWPARLSTACKCRRCEEGRGSHDDDGENETALGCFDLSTLSRHLQSGGAGELTVLHRPVDQSQGVRHYRYQYPYNRGLYEMLGHPKPPARWAAFGTPSAKRRLDFGDEDAGYEAGDDDEGLPPPRKVARVTETRL